jgi:spore coat protein A
MSGPTHHPGPRGAVVRAFGAASLLAFLAIALAPNAGAQQVPLDPRTIPQYVEPLPMPLRVPLAGTSPASPMTVRLGEFQQQLLPASFHNALAAPWKAGTYLWCYQAQGYPITFPGPTFEALVGQPATIRYVNDLQGPGGTPPVLQSTITVDQTIHWADPLGQHGAMTPYVGPVPAVTHLHGGEVPSAYDGGPDAWWTPGGLFRGPGYVTDTYTYPNAQEPTTLWYHDHALGMTRLNVYAGLAGFYLLRDPRKEPANLPGGHADTRVDQYGNLYEREIVIQDRLFDTNGQLLWPNTGINPMVHPYWIPEFFGNVMIVNGKSWPYLQVEPRRYRFRFLNGSNARFYDLSLVESAQRSGKAGPGFWQIGSDGGLLDFPVLLCDPKSRNGLHMILAPGERLDVIVDFAGYAGKTFTMVNTAKYPYPAGTNPNPKTDGAIMQFRVGTTVTGRTDRSFAPTARRALRTSPIERPAVVPVTRALTLNENMGPGGPLEVLVNNTMWDLPTSETPVIGSTEVWEIINLTADTHPIHLHLVQFQLLNRQKFNVTKYNKAYGTPTPGTGPPMDYNTLNAATGDKLGGNPDVTPYLIKGVASPDANETGWKDTFRMNPGEVTRVLVRIAPQDANARAGGQVKAGMNLFPFDPTASLGEIDTFGIPGGPGYVWHCHIIDHEDNEMMRRMVIARAPTGVAAAMTGPAQPEDLLARPTQVALAAAQPNPAVGNVRIAWTLPAAGNVELAVFDLAGREVARLADGAYAAGDHAVSWTGTDVSGRPLPSGTYLYRLRVDGAKFVRKLVLMR